MFKKNELLLISGILLISLLVSLWMRSGSAGAYVQVLVDGEQRLLLRADQLGEHEIHGESGARNVIEITGGGVRMADANCPDRWCVRKGTVSGGPDSIVCLPHRVVVRWADGTGAPQESEEVDVVLQ